MMKRMSFTLVFALICIQSMLYGQAAGEVSWVPRQISQVVGSNNRQLTSTKTFTWGWENAKYAHGGNVAFATGGPLKQQQTAMDSIEDEVADMGEQKSGQGNRKLLAVQSAFIRPHKIARRLLATNTWAWESADFAHGKNVGFETGGPLMQQQAAMDSIEDQVADMSEQKSEQADRKLLSAHRGSSDHQASRHHMHGDRRMGSDIGATVQQTDAPDFDAEVAEKADETTNKVDRDWSA